MTDVELKKSLLSCPGDTIQEHIDHIGMSQAELAERLGRSREKLNELIKGKAPVTKETAIKLEYVLGIPAGFWLNLERQYQDELFAIEQMEYLKTCKYWIRKFPTKALKKMNLLPDSRKEDVLAESLLKFFRIASPKEWETIYQENSVAFKIELKHTRDPYAISVWLRLGEILSEKLTLGGFNKKRIRANFGSIQEIAFHQSEHWMSELQYLCADCGIALVYTPCIAQAPIYGASRWINNHSVPLIQMTDRRKDNHAFWFTFYHELAHILYHGKNDIFMEGLEEISPDKAKEAEADGFAARMLLSDKERNELATYDYFTVDLVLELSRKFRKHPGIIVGQLQRKGVVEYNNVQLNALKARVEYENFVF